MKHIVKFEQGYDCIKFECINGSEKCVPGSGGSHGLSGLKIIFLSVGGKGAVQFVLYTGWLPQYVKDIAYYIIDWSTAPSLHPLPAELGYHSKTPMYKNHSISSESCEYCNGSPCYYDWSALNASDAMYTLVNGGDRALWRFLDAYYDSVFNNGAYPEKIEYKMPVRRNT